MPECAAGQGGSSSSVSEGVIPVKDIVTSTGAIVGLITALVAAVTASLPLLAARRARLAAVVTAQPRLILPARTPLIDRKPQLAQLLTILRSGEPVVAVEGEIGVGKSALAREAAHCLAEPEATKSPRGRFESLIWIDAANGSPGLSDLARTLTVCLAEQSLSAAPAASKADAIRSYLAIHPSVLIVDNFRHRPGTDKQPSLSDFLGTLPTGSVAVVSSNTVGVVPGPRIVVPELSAEDAGALLTREGNRLGVTALQKPTEELAGRIHRLVGGNPRAIALLALRCSRYAGPVSALLTELESSGDLTETLYEQVWQDLPDSARSVLGVCAHFEGGIDGGQLAMALGEPEDQVHVPLERLWVDGLLGAAPLLDRPVYTCSASLRVFVRGRSSTEFIETTRNRMADSLIARFSVDWEDAAGAAPHVDLIRVLIRDLDAAGEYRRCLDLFAAVYDILFTLGLFDDRIGLGWVAFHAAEQLGSTQEQSLALSVVSSTHAIRGEDAQAAHAVERGLAVAEAAGSAREIARQLRCEGFRLFRAGHAEQALAAVQVRDAEAMSREAGDPNNMIDVLSLVGASYWYLGKLDECEDTVGRFLTECDQMPWERGKAFALRDLAEVRLMRGDFDQAQELAAGARRIATEYRDVRQLVRIGLTDARLHLYRGRFRQARELAKRTAAEARSLLLPGEGAEADAVAAAAGRCLRIPGLGRTVIGRPRTRYTDMAVGGD